MKLKFLLLPLLLVSFVFSGSANEASVEIAALLSKLKVTTAEDHAYFATRKVYDWNDGHLLREEKAIVQPTTGSFQYFCSLPGSGEKKELRIVYEFRFDPRRNEWSSGDISTLNGFRLAYQTISSLHYDTNPVLGQVVDSLTQVLSSLDERVADDQRRAQAIRRILASIAVDDFSKPQALAFNQSGNRYAVELSEGGIVKSMTAHKGEVLIETFTSEIGEWPTEPGEPLN